MRRNSILTLCLIASSLTTSLNSWATRHQDAKAQDAKHLDPSVQNPPEGKVPLALVNLSDKTPYAFVVDKELRTLTLWKNSKVPSLVAAYPTDMGKNKGNKINQGDHKTPEGIYFFLETYEQPNLDFSLYGNRAFTMDYPNFFDRMEKKTGSGIWLHAIPDTQTLTRGSRGCVVVRNTVIDQLKPFIKLKNTPIIVQNKVDYAAPEEWSAKKAVMEQWLEKWRAAWEAKDLDSYISHYDESFKALGMGLKQWRAHKESLNARYRFIKVAVDNADIFKNGDQYVFRFTQSYESDKNKDQGEKYLYVRSVNGQLKILGEQWDALEGIVTPPPATAPQPTTAPQPASTDSNSGETTKLSSSGERRDRG